MPPQQIRDRVTFYHACLGSFSIKKRGPDQPNFIKYPDETGLGTGWQLCDWSALLKMAGLLTPPEYVKMDIEGMEFVTVYSMIEQMRRSQMTHMLPSQLSIEFHNRGKNKFHLLPWKETLKWFSHLYGSGGYLMVDFAPNLNCASCDEALFVRLPSAGREARARHSGSPSGSPSGSTSAASSSSLSQ